MHRSWVPGGEEQQEGEQAGENLDFVARGIKTRVEKKVLLAEKALIQPSQGDTPVRVLHMNTLVSHVLVDTGFSTLQSFTPKKYAPHTVQCVPDITDPKLFDSYDVKKRPMKPGCAIQWLLHD